MTYSWSISPQTDIPQDILELARGDTLLARLLLNRGVDSLKEARYYLDLGNIEPSSPLDIPEMDRAFKRVEEAIANNEKIVIFGDYDVDGTSSVALLYRAMQFIGYTVDYYIPSRHLEGYGLNNGAVQKIRQEMGADLMITCDCGISNYAEVEYANAIGLDVIITDHHSIPEHPPPSIANCNPKTLPEEHPLHWLPGVGVAYKLAELILEAHLAEAEAKACAKSLLDLVALGMIADLAPLRSENRYLTYCGLKVLARTSKAGLQELLNISGAHDGADTESVGFGVAPRINAAGRLADAMQAVRLMITEDREEARELCQELDANNRERQLLCDKTVEEALELIANEPKMLEDNCIVLAQPGWHHGVVGIVASRLLDKFHLPVFMIAIEDDIAKASVRSIDIAGLDIYEEMNLIQEDVGLFKKFGGHRMAAGFSCAVGDLSDLIKAIREHFRDRLDDENLAKRISIDTALRLHEVNSSLIQRLEKLAPYGINHRQASFISGPLQVKAIRMLGKDGKHIKLYFDEDLDGKPKKGTRKFTEAVIWNRAQEYLEQYPLNTRPELTVVYAPRVNNYMGDVSMQLDIKDWKDPNDVDPEFFIRFHRTNVLSS